MSTSRPYNLNLLLTYRCNLRCRHCISDCGPERRQAMDVAEAKGYLRRALGSGEVATVGYTGGEPFLVYRMLSGLMAWVWESFGVTQGMVTNAYWARCPAVAASRLRELRERGLRYLTVSCDSFHVPSVDVECIRNAVHAALDLGLTVTVNTTVVRGGRICKRDLPDLLALNGTEVAGAVETKEFGPLRLGRAAREVRAEELIGTEDAAQFDGACPFVIGTPSIAPGGHLYACCCFGNAASSPAGLIAYVGNARKEDLLLLFRRMERDLLLNLLRERGPFRLLQMVREADPSLPVRTKFLTNCEVCVELYHDPAIRSRLARVLRDLARTA